MKFLRWLFGIRLPMSREERLRRHRFGYETAITLLEAGVEPMALLKTVEARHAAGDWGPYDIGFVEALRLNSAAVRQLLEKHHGKR